MKEIAWLLTITYCVLGPHKLNSQTIAQRKVNNDEYWRITKTVTMTELNKRLFGQPNSSVQVTYEDKTLGKTIVVKFATDQQWHRIMFGDFQKWLSGYGTYGSSTDEFNFPMSIAFMSYAISGVQRNELFVLDKLNNRIQVLKINFRFTGTGGSSDTDIEYVTSINGVNNAEDLATYRIGGIPYLVVAERLNHRVLFYDLSTGSYTYRNSYGVQGSGTGQFYFPKSIDLATTVYGQSQLFVDDAGNKRLVKLVLTRNTDGTISASWNATMSFPNMITSLATDEFGNLWLTDYTSDWIRKYDNNFQALATYGNRQLGQGEGRTFNILNFATGSYLTRYQDGSFSFYKNDVSFLLEEWGDESGGVVYDLGTSLGQFGIGYSYNGPTAGTDIYFDITDWSKYYLTIDRLVNGSWQNVRWWGSQVTGWIAEITYPGRNNFFWDGKNYAGTQLPDDPYRFSVQVKEAYIDPDAPIFTSTIIYSKPLVVGIQGPACVIQYSTGNWSSSSSGGGGPYTYQWKRNGVLVGTSSSYSQQVTGGFTLSLTVASGTASSTTSINVATSCGGCPYVFSETEEGLVIDNNILHRSEKPDNKNVDIVDMYRLGAKPYNAKSHYRFRIQEQNDDHAYLKTKPNKIMFQKLEAHTYYL